MHLKNHGYSRLIYNFIKCPKKSENTNYKFPEAKVTSSNSSFGPTNSLIHIQYTLHQIRATNSIIFLLSK